MGRLHKALEETRDLALMARVSDEVRRATQTLQAEIAEHTICKVDLRPARASPCQITVNFAVCCCRRASSPTRRI